MATRTEKLSDVLRGVRASVPEVIGAAVVNRDGFIVASILPNEIDEDLIGAMAASILGVGEKISGDLMRAEMEQTYVRSAKGYIVLNSVTDDAALVLLVTREAKLGMIFLEMKKMVGELARQIS